LDGEQLAAEQKWIAAKRDILPKCRHHRFNSALQGVNQQQNVTLHGHIRSAVQRRVNAAAVKLRCILACA